MTLMKKRKLQKRFKKIFKSWTPREVKKDLKKQEFKLKKVKLSRSS